jgi:hypothetical protein
VWLLLASARSSSTGAVVAAMGVCQCGRTAARVYGIQGASRSPTPVRAAAAGRPRIYCDKKSEEPDQLRGNQDPANPLDLDLKWIRSTLKSGLL